MHNSLNHMILSIGDQLHLLPILSVITACKLIEKYELKIKRLVGGLIVSFFIIGSYNSVGAICLELEHISWMRNSGYMPIYFVLFTGILLILAQNIKTGSNSKLALILPEIPKSYKNELV